MKPLITIKIFISALLALLSLISLNVLAAEGIRQITDTTGEIYFEDEGWSGQWNYICFNNNCTSGTLRNNEWVREVGNLTVGNTYSIQLKIQDNATGQYISPVIDVQFPTGGTSPTPTLTPTATPTTPPSITPTPSATVNPPPTITPAPTTDPNPAPTDFGIEAVDNNTMKMFHVDKGWTAGFVYMCLGSDCVPPALNNGRYERNVGATIGQSYEVEFKVQDNEVGEYKVKDTFTFPGVTPPPTPIPTPTPTPDPNATPTPIPPPTPTPTPFTPPPTNGLPGPIESGGSSSDQAAGLIRTSGSTIITEFAERFKNRHESDDSHDSFVEEYADGSSYGIILRDSPSSLVVEVHSITPLTMVNFTYDHIVQGGQVDPPQYSGGGFMGGSGQRYTFTITDRWAQRRNNGEIVTIEFTPQRSLNGNFPQYYSDIIRYRAGRGGVIIDPENPGQDMGSQNPLYFPGGPTSPWPHASYPDSATYGYSQAFWGIHRDLLDLWTIGRELFRANFVDGEDLTGPLDGNQLVLPGTGFSNPANAKSCVDCHFQLGRSTPPGSGTSEHQGFVGEGKTLRTSPMLIGVGLLEAIDQSTIEGFAASNGGRVGTGRFGWKADQPDLRTQITRALAKDLGVNNPSSTIVDRLYGYIVALGVPISRHPQDQNTQGNNINLRFPEPSSLSTSAIESGRRVFMDKCARCHIPEMKTGNFHQIPQFRNITIRPYTDLLLHDMGEELASTDGGPLARYWRTPPLWGLRFAAQTLEAPQGSNGNDDPRVRLMHDGRAAGISEAIRMHGGEAADAASVANDQNLLLFLQSL